MPNTATRQADNRAASPVLLSRRSVRKESDGGLVKRFLGGEEAAFAELHRRYSTTLLNYVHRMVGDREQAEDLVQEVFLRVYRHLDRFDPRRKFATWIFTIARNVAKDELRRRAVKPELAASVVEGDQGVDLVAALPDDADTPDELSRRREIKKMVHEAIAQMDPHYRSALVLRELQDKTYKEIAEIEGLSLATVKTRVRRARAQFATIVAPMLDPK